MKHILIAFSFCLAAFGAQAQTTPDPVAQPLPATPSAPKAQIVFAETSFDFGDLRQGDKVEHTFNFTNAGQMPLIISRVNTTCGCTASEWTKGPIALNKMGTIKVTFNSANKIGRQSKVVTIVSNAINPEEHVTILSNVLPAEVGKLAEPAAETK